MAIAGSAYSKITNLTYDGGSKSDLSGGPIGKDSSNTSSYSQFTHGQSTANYVYLWFDVSAIPSNAEIDSVVCNVRARVAGTYAHADASLHSGSTKKSGSAHLGATTSTVYTVSGGTWTRDELDDVNLTIYYQSNSSTASNRKAYIYGADLTVTYTYQDKKFMMKLGEQAVRLPDGYTRLASINSNGGAYINTGFVPNQDTRVVCSVQLEPGDSTIHVFGARTAQTSNAFTFYASAKGYYSAGYGSQVFPFPDGLNTSGSFLLDFNKNVISFNGSVVAEATKETFSASVPLYLFCTNTNGTITGLADTSFEYCYIYDNGTLMHSMFACLNPSGVAGMYDVKNGVFYPSETTTPFVAGPVHTGDWHDIARTFKKVSGIWVEQTELANVVDQSKRLVNGGEYVVELPEGYTRLGYIEGTGTQYINTNFKPKYNSRVVMSISGLGTEKVFVFGSRDTAASTAPKQFALIRDSATSIRTDYFGTNQTLDISDTFGRTLIDKNANVTNLFGEELINTAVTSGECANPMFIFTANSVGEAFSPCAKFKLYYCQIFDNGVLVRDYVPCTNVSGTPGLYDLVHGVFYGNAGSGQFVEGESSAPVTRISFTVGGTDYQAEDGMTWKQWAVSSYNTNKFHYDDALDCILDSSDTYAIANTNGSYVSGDDVISNGYAYRLDRFL